MKHKIFIFFGIAFVVLSLIQFSEEVKAVNYDTEIGLTFNNDVASGNTQSTSMTSDNTTNTSSESSTSISNVKTQYPETKSEKPVKSSSSSFLPKAGSTNNNVYLLLGFFILIAGFVLLSFKIYTALKRQEDK
ncbi:hypothetical protein IGL98_001957 [Enterococcus sp. DIV0840]|uniref:LPXTG cell wall anchor domain-containing protein n=1 Tax=unclassified Enterococcus TaxID=2608891 RepID=UPI001A8FE061|nr:LPXTG cell wall anchor domain-containing protein [Enterococcus sp. DIV0849a]MBO0432927.1 LPXTG cell wall anchor domain-containing protein [Enterococcus sp. DIV0849a]